MAEPALTDSELAKLRELLQQPTPSFKQKLKVFAAGLFTGLIAIGTLAVGVVTWRESGEANDISARANHGNLSFEAQFTGPDEKDRSKQKIRVGEKVITQSMFRNAPTFIKLTVKNEGPQNSSITDVGLNLGGGEILWASKLASDAAIDGCNPDDQYDQVACRGLFPKEIQAPGLFTFDFPMWESVDKIIQNGGAESGGITFTLKTIGAGKDEIEIATGIFMK